MSKSVLSYGEFLLEKKAIDQQMADLPKGNGSKSNKSVDTKTADLPKGNGKSISKSVKPEMAGLPNGKGKAINKTVDEKIYAALHDKRAISDIAMEALK